jgi:hypothetical protein
MEVTVMEMNVTGISPMDGVTPVSRIGTYPSIPNSAVNKVTPGAANSARPGVTLTLSPEARKLSKGDGAPNEAGKFKELETSKSKESGRELTQADQAIVRKLQTRDLHVRNHEQQHLAAAGAYAKGGPSFTYQVGPDGKAYAIGGEVQLDVGPVPGNPNATIAKAQVVRRSALAPADPSGADRSIAAAASQMEAQARMELAQKAQSENKSQESGSTSKTGDSASRNEGSASRIDGPKTEGTKQVPFQLRAYQKLMNGLGVKIGRHLNIQV